jgi:hypothetical protein
MTKTRKKIRALKLSCFRDSSFLVPARAGEVKCPKLMISGAIILEQIYIWFQDN